MVLATLFKRNGNPHFLNGMASYDEVIIISPRDQAHCESSFLELKCIICAANNISPPHQAHRESSYLDSNGTLRRGNHHLATSSSASRTLVS